MALWQDAARITVLGVVLLTLGMAIAILGIVTPALFYPGVFGIVAGLVVIAAGSIVHAVKAHAAE